MRRQLQMELGREPNDLPRGRCQEFAMLHQLALVEVSEVSNPVLLEFYLLSDDCIDGMHLPRYPTNDLHRDFAELHDQWRLQLQCNKRNDRHREQILLDEKVELYGDKEFLQICGVELRPEVRVNQMNSEV